MCGCPEVKNSLAARRLQAHPDFANVPIVEKIIVVIEQRGKLTADRLNAKAG